MFLIQLGWLTVGRTPEYLGKKVQAWEVKLAMLAVPVPRLHRGDAVLPAAGPRGLSKMLFAYGSAAGNNG